MSGTRAAYVRLAGYDCRRRCCPSSCRDDASASDSSPVTEFATETPATDPLVDPELVQEEPVSGVDPEQDVRGGEAYELALRLGERIR